MARNTPPKRPYPYTIPTVVIPSDEALAKVNPSLVLEFFRIEAVLRSERCQRLYRRQDGEAVLVRQYYFNWGALKGAHHGFLAEDDYARWSGQLPFGALAVGSEATGVINLSDSLRGALHVVETSEWQTEYTTKEFMDELQQALLTPQGSKLYLEIDTAYPWKWIADDIHNLHEAHRLKTGIRNVESVLMRRSESFYQIPAVPRHSPIIQEPKSWLSYLQCYDLRHCEGLSFGEIAKKVYNAPTGRSQQQTKKRDNLYHDAKRAYYKVKSLIRFAESRNWPPPKPL